MAPLRRLNESIPVSHLFQGMKHSPMGAVMLGGIHVTPRFSPSPMSTRVWNVYSAVYVVAGRAVFEDARGARDVRAGDLMLMFPRHGYAYHVDTSTLWSEVFVQFRGLTFDMWRTNKIIHPRRPVLRLPATGNWLQRFEAVIAPSAVPEPCQTVKRMVLLQEVLIDAVVAADQAKTSSISSTWLDNAKKLIDAQPILEPAQWEAIARQAGMSYDRFYRRFKAMAGISPNQYRASRIMDRACELLNDPSIPLKEIARRCGFSDVFHFSKRFGDVMGIPPSLYRKHFESRAVDPRPHSS